MKTKKQPTPATPTDQRPTCSACHGHNVETTAWISYRDDGTAAIVPGEGPHGDHLGNWCHDCQEHTDLDYPDLTPADRASVQAADAAREAGPELLDALAATVSRLEMIASDIRGGLLGHAGGYGAQADYEAGVKRCHQRAAALLVRLGRRPS